MALEALEAEGRHEVQGATPGVGARDTHDLEAEDGVVEDGAPGEEEVFLGHEADMAEARGVGRAVDFDDAGVGAGEAGDAGEEGGLAGAGGADNGDELASPCLQVDAVEDGDGAGDQGVAGAEAGDFELYVRLWHIKKKPSFS